MPKIFVQIKGSGNLKTEKRDVPAFSVVKSGGAAEVEIAVGGAQSLEIETDDNLLELTKTYVKGDTLFIEREGNIRTKTPLRIRISVPTLDGLDLSGASKGNVTNIKTDKFDLELSGASRLTISGEADSLDADLSGASSLEAGELRTAYTTIEASGTSRANVFATDILTAEASGASRVAYAGNPQSIVKDVSGASSVSPR